MGIVRELSSWPLSHVCIQPPPPPHTNRHGVQLFEGQIQAGFRSGINRILKTAFCLGQMTGEGRVGAKLKHKA
jgi:hypothetical protein